MALTLYIVEQLTDWCARNEEVADIRTKARSDFFGFEDPRPVNYSASVADVKSQERRFLGWFGFSFKLPDGRHPAELAAGALLKEPELGLALKSIRDARYITAIVTSVMPGRCVYLELEDEDFEVNSRYLSYILEREQTVSLHILPIGHGHWLNGPGWITWPIRIGPEMRSQLKTAFQLDPIDVERFLQGRVEDEESAKHETFRDETLEAAVARMSAAAKKAGRDKLVMPVEKWKQVVPPYMMNSDLNGFIDYIRKMAGGFKNIDDANEWLALAQNIWNNTPQPDRFDRSATEIVREYKNEAENRKQDEDDEIDRIAARVTRQLEERCESNWRHDIESKPILINTSLRAALNKMPVEWIDAIGLCLRLAKEKMKRDRVARIVSHYSDSIRLSRTILSLPPRHREALAYIMESGGWVKYGQISRRFGDEKEDGWWWVDEPPQSVIGQLRLRGLLFIGQSPVGTRSYKVAVIPVELRQPILEALRIASEAKAPQPADAGLYQTLGNQLGKIKLRYAKFATEDKQLKPYYRELMAYWNITDCAKSWADGFADEEYLWNFKLPGTEKFLLDYYLEQKSGEVPTELLPRLLNWRGAELRLFRVIALESLVLLEDCFNGERIRCFSLNTGGLKVFRSSIGKLFISFVSPWDDDTFCLLGYSMTIQEGKRIKETFRILQYDLQDVIAKAEGYLTKRLKRQKRETTGIPQPFLKAFEDL